MEVAFKRTFLLQAKVRPFTFVGPGSETCRATSSPVLAADGTPLRFVISLAMYSMHGWRTLYDQQAGQFVPGRRTLSPRPGLDHNYQDRPRRYLDDVVNQDLAKLRDTELQSLLLPDPGDIQKFLATKQGRKSGLKLLGEGGYGTVCQLPAGRSEFVSHLWNDLQGRISFSGELPDTSHPVAIKFVPVTDSQELADALREARLHSWASHAVVPATSSHPEILGSTILPELHFAGLGIIGRRSYWMNVMDRVPGKPLRSRKLNAELYARVEKVVCSLWLIGLAHADLHIENILVDATGRVTLLDLGLAVKLRRDLTEKFEAQFNVFRDPVRLFTEILRPYVYTVMHHRSLDFFNPDHRALTHLYNLVTDKDKVNAARLRAWTGLTVADLPTSDSRENHDNARPRKRMRREPPPLVNLT